VASCARDEACLILISDDLNRPHDGEFTKHNGRCRRYFDCLVPVAITGPQREEHEMFKPLLAGAAAIALTMGVAHAQTTVETTTTRTTAVPAPLPPPIAPYSATRTERSTFGGASTEVQKTYRSGVDGTAATQQETIVHPDGTSQTVTHEERSNTVAIPPPAPAVGTISTTTTRTIR
jgi:hypothetical protein